MMKVRITCMLVILLTICAVLNAQVKIESSVAKQTRARGYWVDLSTGLMWAGKDNEKDVLWKKADRYCRESRLAGYSDWRLASLEELKGIYDKDVESPGMNPKSRWHEAEPMNFHVKGGLFLTGDVWSSSRRFDDRGKPSGYAWRFDFNDGRGFDGDEEWFSDGKRALCVRGIAK